jgi:hypothetical protein
MLMEKVQFSDGQIHGPYLPLTNAEIAQMYPGTLSEHDTMVAQGTHQYRIRSEELLKSGITQEAQLLMDYVQDRHGRLVTKAGQAR